MSHSAPLEIHRAGVPFAKKRNVETSSFKTMSVPIMERMMFGMVEDLRVAIAAAKPQLSGGPWKRQHVMKINVLVIMLSPKDF